MPTRSSLRPSSLPPCTCRPTVSPLVTAPRSYHAATTLPTLPAPPPEGVLDFLYPTFGFFSRSLPDFAPLLLRTPTPRYRPTRVSTMGIGSSWRTGIALEARCACGREKQSCLRCRAASTSARILVDEVPLPASEDDVPPVPTTSPLPNSHSPKGTPPGPLSKKVQLSEVLVPRARTRLGVYRKHKGKATELEMLAVVKMAMDEVWSGTQPGRAAAYRSRVARTSGKWIDLLQLFTEYANAVGRHSKPSPLASAVEIESYDALVLETTKLRHLAGARLGELCALPQHEGDAFQASLASYKIHAVAFQDTLPPILAPTSNLDDPFASDLRRVFQTPSTSLNTQLHTLTALFDAWERSKTGPSEALALVLGWNITEQLGSSPYPTLRRRYGQLLAKLSPSPSIWLDATLPHPLGTQIIGPHLVASLSTSGAVLEALKVWDILVAANVVLPATLEIQLLTTLVDGLLQGRSQFLVDAKRIVARLEPLLDAVGTSSVAEEEKSMVIEGWRMVSKLAALSGRPVAVDEVAQKLDAMGWEGGLENESRYLRALSSTNDLPAATAFFNSVVRSKAPVEDQARWYSELVRAHVRVDDVEGAVKILVKMVAEGTVPPPLSLLNSLLSGYAARNDIDRSYALFNRLGSFNLVANAISYTALVALHSNLRDPESASRVFDEMRRAGVVPSLFTWTTLMNAYVEAGLWTRALEIFAYLERSEDRALRPDTGAINVILKAVVLTGTPAQTSLILFRKAVDEGLRPSFITYTLVMQSLCNAGLMDVAEELFTMMDAPAESSVLPPSLQAVRPDAFIFSTMMNGYLQQNEMKKARACLAEMRARGIPASSVTYGIVIGSFLRDDTATGLELASNIAKEFIGDSPLSKRRHQHPRATDRAFVQGTSLLNVVGPLIVAYARRMKAKSALQLFRQILDEKVEPSVAIYTGLMDAYRRTGATDDVRYLFRLLHTKIRETYRLPSSDPSATPIIDAAHRNTLSLPLTIYLDALSRSENSQLEVIRTWEILAEEGFSFDASNWNMLALASVRDGQIRRAFYIAEHILCRPKEEEEEEVGRGHVFDPDSFTIQFGPSPRLDLAPRTPSRIYQHRKPERDLQRKEPGSIEALLALPPPNPSSPRTAANALASSINAARHLRQSIYWFPHEALLEALEEGLDTLKRSGEEGEALYTELLTEHVRTGASLEGWKARGAEKQAAEDERRGRL
jgi:pentatricopeptide repeat protein